jgi:uncharacterized protein YlxW (UPF0749 family)
MNLSEGALAATVVTATSSVVAAVLATWQGRRAERSAKSTRVIEVGVTALVDQLQEERERLARQVAELEKRVAELRRELDEARDELREAAHAVEVREAEVIRLKRLAGELP